MGQTAVSPLTPLQDGASMTAWSRQDSYSSRVFSSLAIPHSEETEAGFVVYKKSRESVGIKESGFKVSNGLNTNSVPEQLKCGDVVSRSRGCGLVRSQHDATSGQMVRASAHDLRTRKCAVSQFTRSASSSSLLHTNCKKGWEHGRQGMMTSSAGPITPLASSTPRGMQAVEYYSSSVLQQSPAVSSPQQAPLQQRPPPQQDVARPRGGASLAPAATRGRFTGVRASYNERMATRYQPHHHHHHHHHHPTPAATVPELVYRSNSSLELEQEAGLGGGELAAASSMALRREYGSHGSIDVLGDGPSQGGGSFFALLQDFRHRAAPPDQRSPGPARIADVLRGKLEPPASSETVSNTLQTANGSIVPTSNGSNDSLEPDAASPKLRNKLHKFWGEKAAKGKAEAEQPPSLFRKLRGRSQQADETADCSMSSMTSEEERERQRRRAFAHYDCQSVTANLPSAAGRLRSLLLLRRRNTATGASAASMRASTPDAPLSNSSENLEEEDGDGRNNELLDSCPYFRNEIGGEEEREVGLTRFTSTQRRASSAAPLLHRPPLAYGVSVLESPPGETLWRTGACPYQRPARPIEGTDQGALYYRLHFHGQEHQNWFGLDENLGPVAISIKREKVDESSGSTSVQQQQADSVGSCLYQYRVVVRTSELLTLRGAILEDAIPTAKSGKGVSTKELLEYVAPEIQLSCLRLGTATPATEDQLAKLDEQGLSSHYKVGVMYCRAGQATEEEMYNNEEAGPAFHEFLETIGQRVRLRGFDKYKAGLDNKTDSTGLYSVYAQYQDCEIMFHVSTLLPFTPNNRQQLLRKRHIGNDIVTIVFQEPGAQPFTPKNIRSQFQHVFIVVQAVNPCSETTQYRVAVSRSKDVPVFGPPILEGATFPRSKAFADFLLAKVINAENAAHRSEKFATMATRTRQEYLKDLVANHATSTAIETSQKFSMLSFSSKKKERGGTAVRRGAAETWQQRGAVVWQVVLDDSGLSSRVECLLGISTDTVVLIEETSREIVFVSPCRSILGWTASTNSLRLYYHQGECVTVHVRQEGERDELMELVVRLRAVTSGCPAQELALRRNGVGQLGFHVQPDGVVTQVEPAGLAWQAGLRQGARLVEICKVAVSTLSHDQMVDLLKTSIMVTVTVIPPLQDGTSRRGCSLSNCKYTLGNYEGDYENVNGQDDGTAAKSNRPATFQQAGNHRKRYERSLSPPRSSNSSGYGTGSSSKSFRESRFPSNPEGTMTSSSSGHSGDERWYEVMEPSESGDSPPPLPVRLGSGGGSAFHQVKKEQPTSSLTSSASFPNVAAPLQAYPATFAEFEQQELRLGGDKVGDLRSARPRSERAMDYLTRAPKLSDFIAEHQKSASSVLAECGRGEILRGMTSDGHSTGTNSPSDRLMGARSEDELSAGSGSNLSPRLRRGKRSEMTLTPSSGSSRNQSPRTVGSTTPGGRSDNGEARLRPGVTGRSVNRHSASLNSSTLQEDLMRLINPDYLPPEESSAAPQIDEASKLANKLSTMEVPGSLRMGIGRSRSRENLAVGTALSMLTPADVASGSGAGEKSAGGEVIFTTARPATVISNASTASSPAPSEAKLSKEERLSPRVTKLPGAKLPLPDTREMDWPSLVDTAARAMLHEGPMHSEGPRSLLSDGPSPGASSSTTSSSADTVPEAARNGERLGHWVDDVAERLGLDTSPASTTSGTRRQQVMQAHVATLESRVARETRRRLSLEDEVRRLRDENRRLQEESQAAAQQLRRFTEWFFQTLDKH